jgi:hypothetical protein
MSWNVKICIEKVKTEPFSTGLRTDGVVERGLDELGDELLTKNGTVNEFSEATFIE